MVQSDIGLVGLAVMGQNLVLNMARRGFRVAVYNRTAERTQAFMVGPASGKEIQPAYQFTEFLDGLKRPRRVMIMVKAGAPVDDVIEQLLPGLEPGDLLIDGGNSYFKDTERRTEQLGQAGIDFLGVGISGGEAGALWGPSIMPGGQREAYLRVAPIFEAIAARVNGEPCVAYLGPRGAGHYVKMVHNGIEYGAMQLIAEAYDLLRRGLRLPIPQIQEIFAIWKAGPLASFLIDITVEILGRQDELTGQPLVEVILDVASQKGTGAWTSQEAFNLGVPIPTLTAAVEARFLSAYRDQRQVAAELYPTPTARFRGDQAEFIQALEEALYAGMISAYAEGMKLLAAASQAYGYSLELGEIARIWRGGCIIRARLLEDIRAAYAQDASLPNLLLAPAFSRALDRRQAAWRGVIQQSIGMGLPTPALSASLAAFDGYRSAQLPANLIQAQRDYFGAHTHQRVDRDGQFHTFWTNEM